MATSQALGSHAAAPIAASAATVLAALQQALQIATCPRSSLGVQRLREQQRKAQEDASVIDASPTQEMQ